MPFKPLQKPPQFADLKAILSQTQIDNTTYQTIEGLIEKLSQLHTYLVQQIEETRKTLENIINEKTIGGPSPIGTGYLHVTDGVMDVPNSQRIDIKGGDPQLILNDTASAGGAQTIDIANVSAALRFRALNDDATAVIQTLMSINRSGTAVVQGAVHERNRTYAMGQAQAWTPGAFSVPAGTNLFPGAANCSYSVVGHTCFFQLYIGDVSPPPAGTYGLRIPGLPIAPATAGINRGTWVLYNVATGNVEPGWMYVQNDGIILHKMGVHPVTYPTAAMQVWGTGFYYIA